MSALRPLFNTLPAARRSYSSFFSSKPGGGRYFNSAKAKSAVVAAKNSSKSDSSAKESSTTQTVTSNAAQDAIQEADIPSPSTKLADAVEELRFLQGAVQHPHPVMNAKDFKLHQFFSLHRPLLLLHDTPSLFTQGPPIQSIFTSTSQALLKENAQPRPMSIFDEFPMDPSIDADAEAARQLARALTMNKAGAAVTWEQTLKRLGLDPSHDPERIGVQAQMDKDWEDVQILLDSTKRKRRKKMKKHKLKKRRKETRSSRLKLK